MKKLELIKNYNLKNNKNNNRELRKKYNYFNDNIIKDFSKFEKIENKKFSFDKNIIQLYRYNNSYILEFNNYMILLRDNIEKSFYINRLYYIEKFENENFQKLDMKEFIKIKDFIILEDYKINDKIIIILNHKIDIEEK